MSKETSSGSMDLNEIRERTGMMETAKDPSLDIEIEDAAAPDATQEEIKAKLSQKTQPKAETKPAEETKTEGEEPEAEEETEGEEEDEAGDEEAGKEKSNPPAPTKQKGKSPIKAAFRMIGEQGAQIKDLAKAVGELAIALKPKDKEAAAAATSLQKLIKKAEDAGEDPEAIKLMVDAAKEELMKDLTEKGLLSKELPAEVKEKLDVVDEVKAERDDAREVQAFGKEWTGLLPALKQRYPNASDSLLQQAQEEMWKIATGEEGGVVTKKAKTNAEGKVTEQGRIAPYPLDYLLHKFGSKFDTILKVAKASKSSESGSKEIDNGTEDESSDDNIEMPLDEQNPETYLKMQKAKLKSSSKPDVRITGGMQ